MSLKYLTLVVYLFSYTSGFAALALAALAWLRTRDALWAWLAGFLVFFTGKLVVYNAEFFFEVFWGSPSLRARGTNLLWVTLVSLGFNLALRQYVARLSSRVWSKAWRALTLVWALLPLGWWVLSAWLTPLWSYGLEIAGDTVFLVLVTVQTARGRTAAPQPVHRRLATAMVVLNFGYFPLAALKGALDSWAHYDPQWFQLANGYYFIAGLVLAVLIGRHVFLAPATPASSVPCDPTSLGLSDREAEVVRLMAEGLTNKEIGVRLFISAGTVKNHLYNIFRKTGVQSRVELVKRWRETEGRCDDSTGPAGHP